MFAAYTSTSLYIGFRVSDNIVVANPNSSPIYNDEMELFIGGDPTDSSFTPGNYVGDNGAFQLVSDVLGQQAETARGSPPRSGPCRPA